MWYVLQVPTGREDRLIEEIRSYRIQEYFEEVFAPRSVRKKKYRGKWQTSEELLFPGYLFVISENPEELYQALKRIPRMTRILGTGEKWTAMTANDIETVRRLAGASYTGPTWEMAYGLLRGLSSGRQNHRYRRPPCREWRAASAASTATSAWPG